MRHNSSQSNCTAAKPNHKTDQPTNQGSSELGNHFQLNCHDLVFYLGVQVGVEEGTPTPEAVRCLPRGKSSTEFEQPLQLHSSPVSSNLV